MLSRGNLGRRPLQTSPVPPVGYPLQPPKCGMHVVCTSGKVLYFTQEERQFFLITAVTIKDELVFVLYCEHRIVPDPQKDCIVDGRFLVARRKGEL